MPCAGIGLFRIIKKDGVTKLQVCLVRTPAGHESMPKGKNNKKEKPLDCAFRETKEESGFTKDMIKLFDVNIVSFIENTITYFVGIYIGAETFIPHFEDPEELSCVKWYDVDEVAKFDDFKIKPRRKEIISVMSNLVTNYLKKFTVDTDSTVYINYENMLNDFDETKRFELSKTKQPSKLSNVTDADSKQPSKLSSEPDTDSKVYQPDIIGEKTCDKTDMHISKRMSYILRHQLHDLKFKLYKDSDNKSDGSVELKELVKYMKTTEDIIRRIVENNDKQRFSIINRDDVPWIRANQGHSNLTGSLISNEALLKEITAPYELCAHGTLGKHIKNIQRDGLNRMDRKHIHLISSMAAISGFRKSSQVLLHIDMATAMKDGIKFYESDNSVVLTEGINGIINPKYIIKIEKL